MFKITGYIHTTLRREIFLFDEGGGEHTLSWRTWSPQIRAINIIDHK